MSQMTLDEFRMTRVEADDLSARFPEPHLVGQRGGVYAGRWWVATLTDGAGNTDFGVVFDGKPEKSPTLGEAEELLYTSLVIAGADLSPPAGGLAAFDAAVPAPEGAETPPWAAGTEVGPPVRPERSDSAPDPWVEHGPAVVARAKAEILDDIQHLRVSAHVGSFAELRMYTDEQRYGGLLDEPPPVPAERLDFWRQVQAELDAWLKAGRPT